jgi:hypothetical protein
MEQIMPKKDSKTPEQRIQEALDYIREMANLDEK